MSWFKHSLLLSAVLALAAAQFPGWGSCPEYVPMNNFEVNKYMGMWYEAERMFQALETASRCISVNYTTGPDAKVRVYNHVTGRITGIKHILEGELKFIGKQNEGKMSVKYSVLPVPLPIETEYTVLDTDYKSYAVLFHCSSLIPFFNTQNAWVMTRERNAPPPVLELARGVLDKFNIPRSGFTKTLQENCDVNPAAAVVVTTVPPAEAPSNTEKTRSNINALEPAEDSPQPLPDVVLPYPIKKSESESEQQVEQTVEN